MSKKTIEIVSHTPRHHTIGAGYGPPAEEGKPGKSHGRVILKPGTNAVLAADWEQVKELPIIKHYLDLGENGGLVETKITTEDGRLPDKPGEAITLIGQTLDLGRLREWEKTASHGGVKKEIGRQIAKLEEAARGQASGSAK